MQTSPLLDYARRLLTIPAAPYHEAAVQEQVRLIAKEIDLPVTEDEYGNLLVTLANDPTLPPLVLDAHLDHPGFVIRQQLGSDVWLAEFLGGVGDPWFKPGIPLLLMPGRIPATLGNRTSKTRREFEIKSTAPVKLPPQFAVWDLTEFDASGPHIIGRACDDLIGAATILAVLAELKHRKAPVQVIGALCRAEEVGFHGALCLAQSGRLSKESLIISLETSREIPPVRMGEGVIIRVGDKASVFHPEATRFLVEVAQDLQKQQPAFRKQETPLQDGFAFQFQRALMSGGTCEATAYQEFGYRTAAVCVALRNYHNCGDNEKIAPEYVSTMDVHNMAVLLSAAAQAMPRYPELVARLPKRLEGYTKEALKVLRSPSR